MIKNLFKAVCATAFVMCASIALNANVVSAEVDTYKEDASMKTPVIKVTGIMKDGEAKDSFFYTVTPKNDGNSNNGTLYIEYSNNKEFKQTEDYKSWVYYTSDLYGGYNGFSDYSESYSPYVPSYFKVYAGDTIYYRVFYAKGENKRSKYSNVISGTVPVGYSEISNFTAKKTQVSFSISGYDIDGAKIYRKEGKGKFILIDQVSKGSFVDSGLLPDTDYQYRIVAYQYNKRLNKTVDSLNSSLYSIKTKPVSLKVKAQALSDKKAVITWKKAPGVKYYEIYKSYDYSSNNEIYNGLGNDYSSEQRIAKVKKNKTKYTDKKFNKWAGYTVVAVYKKNYKVSDSDSATSVVYAPSFYSYRTGTSAVTVEFNKQPGITQYYIEKEVYDSKGDAYVMKPYKTIPASTKKYTFTCDSNRSSTRYSVYAKMGSCISESRTVYVSQLLNCTTVKATPTSDGIKISWNSVPGAKYYRVYAYYDLALGTYNKNLKTYDFSANGSDTVGQYKNIKKSSYGDYYEYEYDYSNTYNNDNTKFTSTSVVWRSVRTGTDYYVGPKPGKVYSFVVYAYGSKKGVDGGEFEVSSTSIGIKPAPKAAYKAETPAKSAVSKAVNVKGKKAKLTLKSVKGAKYVIYRSNKKNSGYKRVALVTSPSFTDKGLKKKKTYYYKVKTIKITSNGDIVESAMSPAKSVKIKK